MSPSAGTVTVLNPGISRQILPAGTLAIRVDDELKAFLGNPSKCSCDYAHGFPTKEAKMFFYRGVCQWLGSRVEPVAVKLLPLGDLSVGDECFVSTEPYSPSGFSPPSAEKKRKQDEANKNGPLMRQFEYGKVVAKSASGATTIALPQPAAPVKRKRGRPKKVVQP